jgi:hypothetical protein
MMACMSTPNSFLSRGGRPLSPSIPKGEIVASYETYVDAQQAVVTLTKADFPVTGVAIVGNELKSVERVTGKLTWGRAFAAGAISGAWLGLFFGILLFIFSPTANPLAFSFVIAAALIGAGFGMLYGVVSFAIVGRRRDFTSTMQVIASSYSIVVEPDHANRARNVLNGEILGEAAAAPTVPPETVDPPVGPIDPSS